MIVPVSAVRDRLGLNASNSRYPDGLIGSNIRWATGFLEKRTGRVIEEATATRKFTTEGKAYVTIPGLQSASSITLNGSTLTADETYYLIPDARQTGVYTGIQFRAFASGNGYGPWYLGVPDWWDRGLDLPGPVGYGRGSLPNDLTIAGTWGYAAADIPYEVQSVVTDLAAWACKRGDALFGGAVATPEGSVFDLSELPIEARAFIEEWRLQGGGVEAVG